MPTTQKVARTDAGLASELRLSVMRLRRRLANERDPGNQLSMNAMAVLGCLHRQGTMTIGALAADERVQPPSMTRTVSALAEGGYVARGSSDADGRQVVVSLTELGLRTLMADRRRRDEWLATRLRELDADERAVLRQVAPILQKLASSP